MSTNNQLALFFIMTAVFVTTGHAAEYAKGHEALEVFDAEGMDATPRWVMTWLMIMLASFAAGLLFVWRHPIARWVVGCFVAGIVALQIISMLGVLQLSGLIALMHIVFWSPALYQLLTKRPFMADKMTAFSIWSGVITAVILFSFVFDIRDAAIYLNHII